MAGGKVSNAAVAAALMALFVVVAVARADGTICGMDRTGLESCKSYCTAGSTEDKPEAACCTAARGADFACLCRYKAMLRSGNLVADRVMQIPSKCNINKPVPSSCY